MARFPVDTITVGELIDALEDMDRDLPVVLVADYGDHCHTPQALGIKETHETLALFETGYSASGYRVLNADDEERDDETAPKAAVLSTVYLGQ